MFPKKCRSSPPTGKRDESPSPLANPLRAPEIPVLVLRNRCSAISRLADLVRDRVHGRSRRRKLPGKGISFRHSLWGNKREDSLSSRKLASDEGMKVMTCRKSKSHERFNVALSGRNSLSLSLSLLTLLKLLFPFFQASSSGWCSCERDLYFPCRLLFYSAGLVFFSFKYGV